MSDKAQLLKDLKKKSTTTEHLQFLKRHKNKPTVNDILDALLTKYEAEEQAERHTAQVKLRCGVSSAVLSIWWLILCCMKFNMSNDSSQLSANLPTLANATNVVIVDQDVALLRADSSLNATCWVLLVVRVAACVLSCAQGPSLFLLGPSICGLFEMCCYVWDLFSV